MLIRCPDCGGNLKYNEFFDYPEHNGYYCCNDDCEHKELDVNLNEEVLEDQFRREV